MTTPAEVLRVLADPTRRALYERLARGEARVKHLTAEVDVSQAAVSQHLAALREAGLVTERRDGRVTYYSIDPDGLRPLVEWIDRHYEAGAPRVSA